MQTDQNQPSLPVDETDEKDEKLSQKCPFCGGAVEIGCLMGKDGLFGFQWYQGKPTFWKNAFPHGESVGGALPPYGTHLTGERCQNCRKIILDY